MSVERYYVCFTSSFRGDSAPCISHETIDKVKTLCGRKVADAATLEPDDNNLEPDCLRCRNSVAYRRRPKLERDDEAQLKCEGCINGHDLDELRKPCGVTGCECWCNR